MSKVLSCYWKVCINGKELDLSRVQCIESIEQNELCDGSDTCTINVSDPNFVFINDDIFIEEAKVSVDMGWDGETYRVKFNGYISAIDIDFPDSGCPMLSLFCLDESHVMNRKKKQRSWDNVTRPEVVEKIAKEYGFKFVKESGYTFTREDTISQSDVTDIEFIENLAGEERIPFMCKLVGDTIYYVKKGILKDPTSTLYYKKYPYDVVSFSPRINKETIKEEVTSSNISTYDKTISEGNSTDGTTSRDVQGDTPKEGSNSSNSSNSTNSSSGGVRYDTNTGKWVSV